jgi:hypothetical protein
MSFPKLGKCMDEFGAGAMRFCRHSWERSLEGTLILASPNAT